jgi:hypothetical protein
MSTTTQVIPKEMWTDYFNEVGRLYQGWAVTVELLAGAAGDQRFSDGLPFQGISYDPVGSQAGDILVETGDAGTAFETHLIHRPCIVRAAPLQPGLELDIEIEDDEGVTALIQLRQRPELPPPTSKGNQRGR